MMLPVVLNADKDATMRVPLETMARICGLATLAVAIAAAQSQAQLVPRDSAGVRIIQNTSAQPKHRAARTLRLVHQIGSVDGSRGTDFGAILSARMLPSGHVAVVDLNTPEIRLFNGEGKFVRSIGRSGKGPGEFAASPVIAASFDGIWAWDPASRRLSLFSLNGDLKSERTFSAKEMEGVPNALTLKAWHVSRSGAVYSTASRVQRGRSGFYSERGILQIRSDGDSPTHLGASEIVPHPSEESFFVTDPFRSAPSMATVGSRAFVSQTGSWEIRVYGQTGKLTHIVRARIPRKHISPQLERRESARFAEAAQGHPVLTRLYGRLKFADSTSAISAVHSTPDGKLWVARWSTFMDNGGEMFDIIDADGHWLESVRLPPDAGLVVDVSDTHVLTVWRDEMDIPYLRKYRY